MAGDSKFSRFTSVVIAQIKCKLNNVESVLKLQFPSEQKNLKQKILRGQQRELKSSKVRFHLNIEVRKEKEDWLNEIKTKTVFVKDRLNLSGTTTQAANAHLIDALLDNWLKNNYILSKRNIPDECAHQLQPPVALALPPVEDMEVEELSPEMLRMRIQLHSKCCKNDDIYLVCGSAIDHLFRYTTEEHSLVCQCGERFDFSTFKVKRVTKNNHCCKVVVKCVAEEEHTLEWLSSSILSGKYYANLR